MRGCVPVPKCVFYAPGRSRDFCLRLLAPAAWPTNAGRQRVPQGGGRPIGCLERSCFSGRRDSGQRRGLVGPARGNWYLEPTVVQTTSALCRGTWRCLGGVLARRQTTCFGQLERSCAGARWAVRREVADILVSGVARVAFSPDGALLCWRRKARPFSYGSRRRPSCWRICKATS